jgi:hypothetical protein
MFLHNRMRKFFQLLLLLLLLPFIIIIIINVFTIITIIVLLNNPVTRFSNDCCHDASDTRSRIMYTLPMF